MDKGRVSSQIIEISRNKLEDFDDVFFGRIVFELRFGTIFRVKVENEILVDKNETPEEVLKTKSKEGLIQLILGKKDRKDA